MTNKQHFASSKSNEWYTPPRYLAAVHHLLGGIDVDPASCTAANANVRAATFYTVEDDGLSKEWRGRVFLNPPYGKIGNTSQQMLWSHRLIEQYDAGITTEAVLLVTAATSEKWFAPLWAYPLCFTNHRLAFIDDNGITQRGNTKGGAFVYLGPQADRFAAIFAPIGTVVAQYQPKTLCASCGEPVSALRTGRMPRYCGDACRQRAYRMRA